MKHFSSLGLGVAGVGIALALPALHTVAQKGISPVKFGMLSKSKPADATKIAGLNNRFGFRLFEEVAKKEANTNLCVSPTSVAFALQMTYNGAQGTTQTGMAHAMELNGMGLEDVNQASLALLNSLTRPEGDSEPKAESKSEPKSTAKPGTNPGEKSAAHKPVPPQLNIANSLWLDKQEDIRPEFIQHAKEFYKAQVSSLQGAPQTINAWVALHTKDKIPEIVTAADVKNVAAVLVNAVYFKGQWQTPFDTRSTLDQPFHLADGGAQPCKMMMASGHYDYYQSDKFQMVSLPYSGARLDMVLLLPAANTPLNALIADMTSENWKKWTDSLASKSGTVGLPRFRVEYGVELQEALSTLGMSEAFQPTANFSALSRDPLFISKVIHKTFVEVNEEGTEAAAATAVLMPRGIKAHEEPPFHLILDRPFFYAIRDRQTGALLFLGTLAKPI